MSFVDTLARIPKILESNINALLDRAEDPAKMIDQLLVDYKRDLADVKRDTASVIADAKLAKQKLDECDAEIARKERAAENALKAGNEGDARILISAKKSLENTRATLEQNYKLCAKNEELMREAYSKLVNNIEELENRKDAAKAKISAAKAQNAINETLAKAGNTINLESFEKYEQQADKMFAAAQASAELDKDVISTEELTRKYETGTDTKDVDDEIAALKAKLGI